MRQSSVFPCLFRTSMLAETKYNTKNTFLMILEAHQSKVNLIFKGKFEYHICPMCMLMILTLINKMKCAMQSNCLFSKTSQRFLLCIVTLCAWMSALKSPSVGIDTVDHSSTKKNIMDYYANGLCMKNFFSSIYWHNTP